MIKSDEKKEIATYSRVFASRVMHDFAKFGKSPLLGRLLKSLDVSLDQNLRSFFDTAFFKLIKMNAENEYIYKNVLTQRVLLGKHSIKTATIVPELRIGSARADFTIFNGTSTVYEIKTDRDTLIRLEHQVHEYQQAFEFVYVITGESHIDELIKMLPNSVGLLKLSGKQYCSTIRKATSNFNSLNKLLIYNSLQTKEIIEILTKNGQEIPKLPNTLLRTELWKIFSRLTQSQVHENFVWIMKKNRGKQSLNDFIKDVPTSLKYVGLNTSMSKKEKERFIKTLDFDVRTALSWA